MVITFSCSDHTTMACFVTGCKSGHSKGKEKCPVFKAAKDQALFHQWSQCIPSKKRELRKSDKICARHFAPHLISGRYYSEYKVNVLLNEPKVQRLRKGAVPSIFECCKPQCIHSESPEGQNPTSAAALSHPPEGRVSPSVSTLSWASPMNVQATGFESEIFAESTKPNQCEKTGCEGTTRHTEIPDAPGTSCSVSAYGCSSDWSSVAEHLLQHPEDVSLPPRWNYHKVRNCRLFSVPPF
ncbi:hypothetical protein HPB48_003857 [Haemaphysalis longicornis]|uniref:THAP-type domain-containing protein n=1 Tax=Haemaphysalis longicornis TaxID=44386 RepID=A0A9J6FJG3_HAELO|nr:hypothetical protein HPB48_003857 [Haemaphysalis longicornis]